MRTLLAVLTLALLAGCESAPPKGDYRPTVADFYLESSDARAATVTLPTSGVKLAVAPVPAFRAADIMNVELARVELGQCLMFQLTPAATRDLYRVSVANQGRRLVLVLNGTAAGARPIEGPLADGVVFMFVEMPDDALPGLVANLKRTTVDIQKAVSKRK